MSRLTNKEALETIANIELYHREFDEDEDFDGDWKYLEYTEYDGLVCEVYKKEIDIIKQALERLEVLEKENIELRQDVSALEDYSYDVDCENEQLKDSIEIKQKQVNECIDTLTQKIEQLKKAIEKASKILSWDCPCSQDLIDDLNCENRCQPDIDYAECWKKYFFKEVLDE